jgi:hypothetical protein
MQTGNITLCLSKEDIKKAKKLADKRGITVSSLLVQLLNQLVDEENQYNQAQQRQIEKLHTGLNLGVENGVILSREDLHEHRR